MPDLMTLFTVLVRFEAGLWCAVDARLRKECSLPFGWFAPLRVIAGQESCRVREIADELSITVGAASKRVDRIEDAGLCRRRSHPRDRRSSIIELTPAGWQLLERAHVVVDAELCIQLGPALVAAAVRPVSAGRRRPDHRSR